MQESQIPSESSASEPRFFFLMPVWGETYVEYLLTFGLPTLLSPDNLPWLPNRAQSQFTFLTTAEDEARIRQSRLFALLESLVPVKFVNLTFYRGSRQEKFNQLGHALQLGCQEALGKGYCFFLHPDGLYSDGMMRFLYGVAKSGKKACVSHGPVVTQETITPYLRERGLHRFDEVNALSPRVIARALLDNLHPDMAIHCFGNPHYPEVPYMGFWLLPDEMGALFRFVSLHPWMVDLRDLTEIADFSAIDHNFVRSHPFIWTDEVHIEADSDHFLVIGIKPRDEMNARPSRRVNQRPDVCLARSLFQNSNCNYSRSCFFHGMKVRTGGSPEEWRAFEVQNLKQLNDRASAAFVFRSAQGRMTGYVRTFLQIAFLDGKPAVAFAEASRVLRRGWRHTVKRMRRYSERFYHYVIVKRQPGRALRYSWNIARGAIWDRWFGPKRFASAGVGCAACGFGARRCIAVTDTVKRSAA